MELGINILCANQRIKVAPRLQKSTGHCKFDLWTTLISDFQKFFHYHLSTDHTWYQPLGQWSISFRYRKCK